MTGEHLYIIYCDAYASTFKSHLWKDLHADAQAAWDRIACEATWAVLQTAPPTLMPHAPSQIPPIVPLPKDRSWDQWYTRASGVDAARIKELYNAGRSKEWLLRAFANLSCDELDRILAT